MSARQLPVRTLPERPDLDQLKRQAKELLQALRTGDASAVAEVKAYYHGADVTTFALHDARLVLARAYGFESWQKLNAYVDGANVRRFIAAVRANDAAKAIALLKARPELVNMVTAEDDERRALHHAVLDRSPDMVRLLMEHGADARKGVYPHRQATSALTLAAESGYDEIVAVIHEEEQRRSEASGGTAATAADELCEAIAAGNEEAALALLAADPALVHARHRDGWTPLHLAAARLNERLVNWLLDHAADANARRDGQTPLDRAAQARGHALANLTERFSAVAWLLRQHGGELTARAAVALGQVDWLRAKHAESMLINLIEPAGGLLTIAANHDRLDLLNLLLDFGFDPDERKRVEDLEKAAFSWGMPLWYCAGAGRYELAETLLTRGADPNGQVDGGWNESAALRRLPRPRGCTLTMPERLRLKKGSGMQPRRLPPGTGDTGRGPGSHCRGTRCEGGGYISATPIVAGKMNCSISDRRTTPYRRILPYPRTLRL